MNSDLNQMRFSESERSGYEAIYAHLRKKEKPQAAGADFLQQNTVATLMSASGLSTEELKTIWKKCVPDSSQISKTVLFMILKMIFLCQNKMLLITENFAHVHGVPKFTGLVLPPEPKPPLSANSLLSIETFITKFKPHKEDEFKKADWPKLTEKIPPDVSEKIWNLVDTSRRKALSHPQLIVALALASKYHQTKTIDAVLDSQMQSFIQIYQMPPPSQHILKNENPAGPVNPKFDHVFSAKPADNPSTIKQNSSSTYSKMPSDQDFQEGFGQSSRRELGGLPKAGGDAELKRAGGQESSSGVPERRAMGSQDKRPEPDKAA